MLKYLYTREIFREIPGEITLGISISGCKIHCPDCNQKELWEDKGTLLTDIELLKLLEEHKGVTCLLILGGEHGINHVIHIMKIARRAGLKTAWYCGLDRLPKEQEVVLKYLDWFKIGSYKKNLGGLDSPTTNQRLYWINRVGNKIKRTNVTHLLQKQKQNENKSI